MEDTIITIKAEHIIENVINKSRFIAHIKPVESEEDAKAFINQVSTKHREAAHNCSAYTIGDQMNIQKANDNGEPSGTAGVPMLDILKKLEIHNACVVVTRYFGGIKLGGGGLIRAYSGGVELKPAIPTTVTINYDLTGKFEYELESTSYLLRDQSYTDKVSYQIDVVASDYDEFIAFLNRTTSGNYDLVEGEVMRLPFDIPTD